VQGHEDLSLLPERAPSDGPRSTAAVKSSSRPCLAEHWTGNESMAGRTQSGSFPLPRSLAGWPFLHPGNHELRCWITVGFWSRLAPNWVLSLYRCAIWQLATGGLAIYPKTGCIYGMRNLALVFGQIA